jgi:pilus assembly protein Flp/PilA
MKHLKNFIRNQDGVTAIEYALIASLIAVFIVAAVQAVGTRLSTVFTEVGHSLSSAKTVRSDGRLSGRLI